MDEEEESKGQVPGRGHEIKGGVLFVFVFVFLLFRAAPMAYGVSQARGQIGAIATSLHHSHSNIRSGPYLPPIPQLTATPDP